ncbi:sigma-54-dependent transcriptional regulator [Desulfonatronovibrio magnus]|uniref:sigma-54-dependent transcriptional regulator n=1 Tax=Desulfonatronovibrio magnus TaxID=698827 RepID=UPI0005EBE8E2|nr:sigma-54 dependent transcriptional regulator [Desulfonatronovibrio magnus]
MTSIISIDKNQDYQNLIKDSLPVSYDLSLCNHVEELEYSYPQKSFDLGIIDLNAGGAENLTSLNTLSKHLHDSPIIVTSEKEDADWVVKVVKAGAFDFLSKPFSGEKLRLVVDRALEKTRLKDEIDYLRRQQDVIYDLDKIIAASPSMKAVMSLVRKYSSSDANILITGATGTGKSFLAGAIHFNSLRKAEPFVKINCANIPETLLESELFGHEKGAFTGAVKTRKGRVEQARGGTVFLDEIGEMSPGLQSKFLQVVEEKSFERLGGNKTIKVDVRFIVATNQDLAEMVREGEFRQDLYFRLNVLAIHLPALALRQDCIPLLADHLLSRICRRTSKSIKAFSSRALQKLKEYPWPGNIRELSNVIERAVLLENGPVIRDSAIQLSPDEAVVARVKQGSKSKRLDESEYKTILDALESNLWVQKKAAQQLGISPRSLNYKINKLGITHWSWRRNKGVGEL